MAEGAEREGKKKNEGQQESEPAWPPREAAPRDVVAQDKAPQDKAPQDQDAPDSKNVLSSAAAPGASTARSRSPGSATTTPVMLPPSEADAQVGAALPGQEMAFSDSTLHWLQDGETGRTTRPTSPTGSLPSYDPRAPIAGRPRAYLVVGGAAALAMIVAGTLFFQAQGRPTPAPRPTVSEPARDFTARAEAALAANRVSEALDLAHLALTADQRHADAHFVLASCERARNQPQAARNAYRKYLELAPLGRHAAEARAGARLPTTVTRTSLAALHARYVLGGQPLPAALEATLRADPRAGAQAILTAVARRRRANRAEGQRLRTMLRYETALWNTGIARIAGVDEAGMSPLAGPVAAAAVILAPGTRIAEVDDSKRLDVEQRERLAPIIKDAARSPGRWASPRSTESTRLTSTGRGCWPCAGRSRRSRRPPSTCSSTGASSATCRCRSSASSEGTPRASRSPRRRSSPRPPATPGWRRSTRQYPGYGFAKHKGYPVTAHVRALGRLGACPIHRRSFAPVRKALGLPPLPPWPVRTSLELVAPPARG